MVVPSAESQEFSCEHGHEQAQKKGNRNPRNNENRYPGHRLSPSLRSETDLPDSRPAANIPGAGPSGTMARHIGAKNAALFIFRSRVLEQGQNRATPYPQRLVDSDSVDKT